MHRSTTVGKQPARPEAPSPTQSVLMLMPPADAMPAVEVAPTQLPPKAFGFRVCDSAAACACRICHRDVRSGDLCLVRSAGKSSFHWWHLRCRRAPPAPLLAAISEVSAAPGYAELNPAAQLEVSRWWNGISEPQQVARFFQTEPLDPSTSISPPPLTENQSASAGPSFTERAAGTASGQPAAADASDTPARKRSQAHKDGHIEKIFVKRWRAFPLAVVEDEDDLEKNDEFEHCQALLAQLQHSIFAHHPVEAMRLQALLMRNFSRLRAPLAQAGLSLLRGDLKSLLRFGRRMAASDREVSCCYAYRRRGALRRLRFGLNSSVLISLPRFQAHVTVPLTACFLSMFFLQHGVTWLLEVVHEVLRRGSAGKSKSSYEGIEDEGQHDSYCDHPTGVYTDWRRAEDGEDEASLAGLSNPDDVSESEELEGGGEGSLDDDSHSFSARVEATASCVREVRKVLKDCDAARSTCTHPPDLHGALGLLYHRQLALVAILFSDSATPGVTTMVDSASLSPPLIMNGNGPPSDDGVSNGVAMSDSSRLSTHDLMVFEIDATIWERTPRSALLGEAHHKAHRRQLRQMRQQQAWRTHSKPSPRRPMMLPAPADRGHATPLAFGQGADDSLSACRDLVGAAMASVEMARQDSGSVQSVHSDSDIDETAQRATTGLPMAQLASAQPRGGAGKKERTGAATKRKHSVIAGPSESVQRGELIQDLDEDMDENVDMDPPAASAATTENSSGGQQESVPPRLNGAAEKLDEDGDDGGSSFAPTESESDSDGEGEGNGQQSAASAMAKLKELADPVAALRLASMAYTHLQRGLEARPDSTIYAFCMAQVLVLMARLTNLVATHSSDAKAGGLVALTTSDTEAGNMPGGTKESTMEMHLRSAEHCLYSIAHESTVIGADDSDGRPPTAMDPPIIARQVWLHWLQRHAPHDMMMRCEAAAALLRADPTSQRAWREICSVAPWLYPAQDAAIGAQDCTLVVDTRAQHEAILGEASSCQHDSSDAEGYSDGRLVLAGGHVCSSPGAQLVVASPMRIAAPPQPSVATCSDEDVCESRDVLTPTMMVELVAMRIETFPREELAWTQLEHALRYALGIRDTHVLAGVTKWWAKAADFWPELCFEAFSSAEDLLFGEDEDVETDAFKAYGTQVATLPPTLWALRESCASLLRMILVACEAVHDGQMRTRAANLAAGIASLRSAMRLRIT